MNKGSNVGCIRLIVTTGCICLWLAFFASAVSIFSPAWITMIVPGASGDKINVHVGLVVYCKYAAKDKLNLVDHCTWFKEGSTKSPDWIIACRGLIGAGCGLLLLTTMCCLFLCGRKFQNPECSSFIIAGNFLAFGAMLSSVITFGIKAGDEYNAEFIDRSGPVYLDWSFYLAVVGSGLSLVSLVVIITAVYYTSNDSPPSYGRMQAHQNGNYLYMQQKA